MDSVRVVPSVGSGSRSGHGRYLQGKNLPWPLSSTSSAMDNNDSNDWILPIRTDIQSEWVNPVRSRDMNPSSFRCTDAMMEKPKPASVELIVEEALEVTSDPEKEKPDQQPTRSIVHFSEDEESISVQTIATTDGVVSCVTDAAVTASTSTAESAMQNSWVPKYDSEKKVQEEEQERRKKEASGPSEDFQSDTTALRTPEEETTLDQGDDHGSLDNEDLWGPPNVKRSISRPTTRQISVDPPESSEMEGWVPPGEKQKSAHARSARIDFTGAVRNDDSSRFKWVPNPSGMFEMSSSSDEEGSVAERVHSRSAPPRASNTSSAFDVASCSDENSSEESNRDSYKERDQTDGGAPRFANAYSAFEVASHSDDSEESSSKNSSVYNAPVRSAPRAATRSSAVFHGSSAYEVASSNNSSNAEMESETDFEERDNVPDLDCKDDAKRSRYFVSASGNGESNKEYDQSPENETDDEDENDRFDDEYDSAAAGLASLTAALHSPTNGTLSDGYGVDQEQPSGFADPVELEEQRPPPPPDPDDKSAPLSRTPRNSKTPLMMAILCILILVTPGAVVAVVFLFILDDGGNDNADRVVESPRQTFSPITPTILSPALEPAKQPDGGQTKLPVFTPTANQQPVIPPTRAPSVPTSPPTLSPISQTPDALIQLLSSVAADGGASLRDPSSPQYRAMQWIRTGNNIGIYEDRRFLQRYALAALYYSTNGEAWSQTGLWLTAANECDWLSFSEADAPACDSAGNILYMDLAENNLRGPLPPDLALLARTLETLTLSGNNINGRLPVAYSLLSNLSILELSSNQMTGSIPSQYSRLTGLTSLYLSSNLFRNTIPTELSSLTELRVLDLSKNGLTGLIPTQLGLVVELSYLSLFDNLLTGPIPAQIGNLTKLNELYLDNTGLEPSLPAIICALQLDEFWTDCTEIGGCSCCSTCCLDGLTCFPNL